MRGNAYVSPSSSCLVAFKPRQVLLSEQRQKRSLTLSTPMANNKPGNPTELKPEDESALICSVALWLEKKGFSKVLKRFLSAAQIQDDNWKARALNLNEIFAKYLEICNGVHEDLKFQKKQVGTTVTNGDAKNLVSDVAGGKKGKKKSKKHAADTTPEDTVLNEKMNVSQENIKEDQSHKTSDCLSPNDQKSKASKESNDDKVSDTTVDQSAKKHKDKKKKKHNLASQSLDSEEKQVDTVPEVTKSKHKCLSKNSAAELLDRENATDRNSEQRLVEVAEDGVNRSKKASKKRKRTDAEENENQFDQEVAVEKSKAKKTKGLEDGKNVIPEIAPTGANGHGLKQHKGENIHADQMVSQKLSPKQTDESTEVTLRANGVDKSQSKSARRNHKSSAEPKNVNAFQRVKVEDVKFADERLQDNSYWAKDGADDGYGARAQEVLGQVKGRGFRHEKTKKKRGSYRGGQIDVQSHSIKFNYSDEE